ncbi:MAG: zinc metalloprotease, partial [Nocardioides sp.]|nr:zinc metalloprotease [Nocardioides sp.]
MRTLGLRLLALSTTTAASLMLTTVPASALMPDRPGAVVCAEQEAASSAKGGRGADHRDISAAEQREIAARTQRILTRQGGPSAAAALAGGSVPVYVHVMASKSGAGDVTDSQIAQQVQVLNTTYG